jgi:hypothetical protein
VLHNTPSDNLGVVGVGVFDAEASSVSVDVPFRAAPALSWMLLAYEDVSKSGGSSCRRRGAGSVESLCVKRRPFPAAEAERDRLSSKRCLVELMVVVPVGDGIAQSLPRRRDIAGNAIFQPPEPIRA